MVATKPVRLLPPKAILKLLKHHGGNCSWRLSRSEDGSLGYQATLGTVGMRIYFPAAVRQFEVAMKAGRVQEELVKAHRDHNVWGEKIDAKTGQIQPRKTG